MGPSSSLLLAWFAVFGAPDERGIEQFTTPAFDCQGSANVWSRARRALRASACQKLLRATAALGEDPPRARKLAEEAAQLLPAGPARARAQGIVGYAALLGGDAPGARAAFEAAEAGSGGRLPTLIRLGAARAAGARGDWLEATRHYRRALLEADEALGSRRRARACLEAAFALLQIDPERDAEALAYVNEAERAGEPFLVDYARSTRVLIALRAGHVELAREIARGFERDFSLEWYFERAGAPGPSELSLLPLLPNFEREALLAAVDDARGAPEARFRWEKYLEDAAEEAPAHLVAGARARLAVLGERR